MVSVRIQSDRVHSTFPDMNKEPIIIAPEMGIRCPTVSIMNLLSHNDFMLSIRPLVCYIVLAAICNNTQKEGFSMSIQPKKASTVGPAQLAGDLESCH